MRDTDQPRGKLWRLIGIIVMLLVGAGFVGKWSMTPQQRTQKNGLLKNEEIVSPSGGSKYPFVANVIDHCGKTYWDVYIIDSSWLLCRQNKFETDVTTSLFRHFKAGSQIRSIDRDSRGKDNMMLYRVSPPFDLKDAQVSSIPISQEKPPVGAEVIIIHHEWGELSKKMMSTPCVVRNIHNTLGIIEVTTKPGDRAVYVGDHPIVTWKKNDVYQIVSIQATWPGWIPAFNNVVNNRATFVPIQAYGPWVSANLKWVEYDSVYYIQNGYKDWSGGYLDVRGTNCQKNKNCVSTAESKNRDSENDSGKWKIVSKTGAKGHVKTGDLVQLVSQFDAGKGGYLDTREKGCNGNKLCVSTSDSANRADNSGTWKIVFAVPPGRDKIYEHDPVLFENQFSGGGYLDTRGVGCKENKRCVSTSEKKLRDQQSTYWRLSKVW